MENGYCDMERPRVSFLMVRHTNCVDRYMRRINGYAVVGVSEAGGVRKFVSLRAAFVFANKLHVFAFCQQDINLPLSKRVEDTASRIQQRGI
jgi:hypothetical protein